MPWADDFIADQGAFLQGRAVVGALGAGGKPLACANTSANQSNAQIAVIVAVPWSE